jgi:hypothetical protein
VLPLAAVEGLAGCACVALSVVADAAKVAVGPVGEKDVSTQIDRLRCALEAPPGSGKGSKIHIGVDGDEHIYVLRHGLSPGSQAGRSAGHHVTILPLARKRARR